MGKEKLKSAVIIKGNPYYLEEGPDVENYANYYKEIENELRKAGYGDITYDRGDDYTTPRDADLWVGHSRGAGRLRFNVPERTKTLDITQYEDGIEEYKAMLLKEMQEKGYSSMREFPVEERTRPGPEHYTVTDRMREAIQKTASAQYRPRGTLILRNDKGQVYAGKSSKPGTSPYYFPGGGIFEEEGVDRVPTAAELEEGMNREALEELGYALKNYKPLANLKRTYSKEWQDKAEKKRGVKYLGENEYYATAELGDEDKSLYDVEGDAFTSGDWYDPLVVAKALEEGDPNVTFYDSNLEEAAMLRELHEKTSSLEKEAKSRFAKYLTQLIKEEKAIGGRTPKQVWEAVEKRLPKDVLKTDNKHIRWDLKKTIEQELKGTPHERLVGSGGRDWFNEAYRTRGTQWPSEHGSQRGVKKIKGFTDPYIWNQEYALKRYHGPADSITNEFTHRSLREIADLPPVRKKEILRESIELLKKRKSEREALKALKEDPAHIAPAPVSPPVISPPVISPPVISPPVVSPPVVSPPVVSPPVAETSNRLRNALLGTGAVGIPTAAYLSSTEEPIIQEQASPPVITPEQAVQSGMTKEQIAYLAAAGLLVGVGAYGMRKTARPRGFLTSGDQTTPEFVDENYSHLVPAKPKRKRKELEEAVLRVQEEIANTSPEDMEYSKLVASGLPMEEIIARELIDPYTDRANWKLTPEEYKQFRNSVIKGKKKLYPVARPFALAERYGIDLGLPEEVAQEESRSVDAFRNFSYPSFHTARGTFLAETARDLVPEADQKKVDDLISRIGRARIQQGVHSHQDVEAGESLGREAARIYKEKGIKTASINSKQYPEEVAPHFQGYISQKRTKLTTPISDLPQPPYPANDSEETRNELLVIKMHMVEGKLPESLMILADREPEKIFNIACEKFGIDHKAKQASVIKEDFNKIAFDLKYIFKRPRPWSLTEYHGIDLNVAVPESADTPSYPSGHAMMGYGLAEFYKSHYPEYTQQWDKIADIIQHSRLQAGLHFPSDIEYAKQIVDEISSREKVAAEAPYTTSAAAAVAAALALGYGGYKVYQGIEPEPIVVPEEVGIPADKGIPTEKGTLAPWLASAALAAGSAYLGRGKLKGLAKSIARQGSKSTVPTTTTPKVTVPTTTTTTTTPKVTVPTTTTPKVTVPTTTTPKVTVPTPTESRAKLYEHLTKNVGYSEAEAKAYMVAKEEQLAAAGKKLVFDKTRAAESTKEFNKAYAGFESYIPELEKRVLESFSVEKSLNSAARDFKAFATFHNIPNYKAQATHLEGFSPATKLKDHLANPWEVYSMHAPDAKELLRKLEVGKAWRGHKLERLIRRYNADHGLRLVPHSNPGEFAVANNIRFPHAMEEVVHGKLHRLAQAKGKFSERAIQDLAGKAQAKAARTEQLFAERAAHQASPEYYDQVLKHYRDAFATGVKTASAKSLTEAIRAREKQAIFFGEEAVLGGLVGGALAGEGNRTLGAAAGAGVTSALGWALMPYVTQPLVREIASDKIKKRLDKIENSKTMSLADSISGRANATYDVATGEVSPTVSTKDLGKGILSAYAKSLPITLGAAALTGLGVRYKDDIMNMFSSTEKTASKLKLLGALGLGSGVGVGGSAILNEDLRDPEETERLLREEDNFERLRDSGTISEADYLKIMKDRAEHGELALPETRYYLGNETSEEALARNIVEVSQGLRTPDQAALLLKQAGWFKNTVEGAQAVGRNVRAGAVQRAQQARGYVGGQATRARGYANAQYQRARQGVQRAMPQDMYKSDIGYFNPYVTGGFVGAGAGALQAKNNKLEAALGGAITGAAINRLAGVRVGNVLGEKFKGISEAGSKLLRETAAARQAAKAEAAAAAQAAGEAQTTGGRLFGGLRRALNPVETAKDGVGSAVSSAGNAIADGGITLGQNILGRVNPYTAGFAGSMAGRGLITGAAAIPGATMVGHIISGDEKRSSVREDHVEKRRKERAPHVSKKRLAKLKEAIIAKETKLPAGDHHVRLDNASAVIKDIGGKHVISTILGAGMKAPGKNLRQVLKG